MRVVSLMKHFRFLSVTRNKNIFHTRAFSGRKPENFTLEAEGSVDARVALKVNNFILINFGQLHRIRPLMISIENIIKKYIGNRLNESDPVIDFPCPCMADDNIVLDTRRM